MKPTMELRFVIRGQLPPILQQKWERELTEVEWLIRTPKFEWRDVPVVKEEE